VVERGYAVVEDRAGGVVTSAAAARAAARVRLRFADATADATIEEDQT
jgi:exodeoxyribonuclease VII large subunit